MSIGLQLLLFSGKTIVDTMPECVIPNLQNRLTDWRCFFFFTESVFLHETFKVQFKVWNTCSRALGQIGLPKSLVPPFRAITKVFLIDRMIMVEKKIYISCEIFLRVGQAALLAYICCHEGDSSSRQNQPILNASEKVGDSREICAFVIATELQSERLVTAFIYHKPDAKRKEFSRVSNLFQKSMSMILGRADVYTY